MKKYSIVIPTYNHCDDLLKPCIESIIKYTDLDNVEIIIVANGCTDNTKDYANNLNENFKIIWSDEPLGYTKATNLGIKESTGDYVILLNNDCVLLGQEKNTWINRLEKPFLSPSIGMTGVLELFDPTANIDFLVFFCVMIKREVFNKIGILDEIFSPGFGEDIDFAARMRKFGYDYISVEEFFTENGKVYTNFPIWHRNNQTFGKETTYKDVVKRNQKILFDRYLKSQDNIMKKSNPHKIGVITPSYNSVNYIPTAIASVNNQTLDNVVHYIYDDASTDNFLESFGHVFDQNTVLIRGETNKGQSNARNVCIRKAIQDGCKFVAFLDADDSWEPNHLEKSLDYLNLNDIVYSYPKIVDENNNQMFIYNTPVPNIFVGKHLLHNNYIWISSVVANVKCFRNNEFDDNLNSLEDWDMWIRLWQQNYKFVNKTETTVKYLIRESGQASLGSTKRPLFESKHKLLPKLKLHLACGHDYDDSYINVDLYAPEDARCDIRFDVQKLPYPDNSVDEIKAFHIIEHFHFFEIQEVLKEWNRVLKPGGKLWLETPDFLESCRSFVEGSSTMNTEDWRVLLYNHFFAHPWVPGQTHKFLFTESQLRTNMSWAGFSKVVRSAPASKYVMNSTRHLFLNVEAFK